MDVLGSALSAAVGAIVTVLVGWLIAKWPPLKEKINSNESFKFAFKCMVATVCFLFLVLFCYDRFVLPNEINQESQAGVPTDPITTPTSERTVSCKTGYYAVGVTVTGNPVDKCIGCLTSIKLICKKL